MPCMLFEVVRLGWQLGSMATMAGTKVLGGTLSATDLGGRTPQVTVSHQGIRRISRIYSSPDNVPQNLFIFMMHTSLVRNK